MNIRKLDFRRILTYTAILSLLIYYIFAWVNAVNDPNQRTGSDFMGFYSFGRISETKGIEYIYDLEVQKKLQEDIVGHAVIPIFHTHIPLTAPLSMLVSDEDYVASFKRWAIVLLFLNALNVCILVNMLEIRKFTKENLIILALGAYLFDPTFSGFMNGQDTAIVLLGAALWAYGFFSKKYTLAGIGLSLTAFRPQVALFLAIPFFFHHRKVFWGFVIGGSILVAISVGLLKYEGTLKFIAALRYIQGTVWHESHALDMPTLSGIIRRNFTVSDPRFVSNLVWVCYTLGIAGFSFLWHKSPEIDERHIGLLSTLGVFLVPYAHYHDLILWLIPIFCILRIYQREDAIHQNYLAIAPLIVSWLFALGFAGTGLLKFSIVYMVMLCLIYFLIIAGKQRWKVFAPASL
jgi:glycosyl transferase family 87